VPHGAELGRASRASVEQSELWESGAEEEAQSSSAVSQAEILSREEMLSATFQALAEGGGAGKKGRIERWALFRFAGLIGIECTEEEWASEYAAACKQYGFDADAGLDFAQFATLVNEEEENIYATDAELLWACQHLLAS